MQSVYVSPAKTRPEHVLPVDLAAARVVLKRGGSLSEAAVAIGATVGALDQALWRNLGGLAR